MNKIGFVDLYLSEWHANNYPQWIKDYCQQCGLQYEVCYAWADKDVSPVDNRTTDQWCKDLNIAKCDTIKELCEKSDFIILLAPSNPEEHLRLAKMTFEHAKGKRMYIDKTFAPDLETAKEIYRLAEENNIKFFSTSALRYASELNGIENAKTITTKGRGRLMVEYIIHQIEMVVKTMGVGASRVKCDKIEDTDMTFDIEYLDGRVAKMHFCKEGFGVELVKSDGTKLNTNIESEFFKILISKIIIFFQTGEIDFAKEQTLEVIKIREAVIKSEENLGKWIQM